MTDLLKQAKRAVEDYVDPMLQRSLGEAKCIQNFTVENGRAKLGLRLGFPARSHIPVLEAELRARLLGVNGVESVDIDLDSRIDAHETQKNTQSLKNIKNIIAVASGKGGVGKSTVSSNLALALAAEGARTAMLDADIYGPSQPRMLGVGGQPDSKDGKRLEPMVSFGVQSMSIGYLIDEETPMIWRGPMVTQALEQLLKETNWQAVDYLIVDMPPGTGDIQLTLSQKIPVSGALIVTTPQDIALLDARKAVKMFEKVEVPVLGVVENMSIHRCSKCGHEEHIFGSGGGERMAQQYGVPMLGSLPLDIAIREDMDKGYPTVVREPDGPLGVRFRDVALRLSAALSLRAKDHSQAFPTIVMQ